jgi:transketolase
VLLGDGECQAGIVWEGAMTAAKYKLSNLIVIVDYNDVQLDGPVHTIMPIEPFYKKWHAHNWAVQEVNGHDIGELMEVFDLVDEIHDRPIVIIAHTTKGKGVSFMENQSHWHGVPPDDTQFNAAVLELKGGLHG